jgi:hypothetical protein
LQAEGDEERKYILRVNLESRQLEEKRMRPMDDTCKANRRMDDLDGW